MNHTNVNYISLPVVLFGIHFESRLTLLFNLLYKPSDLVACDCLGELNVRKERSEILERNECDRMHGLCLLQLNVSYM